MYYKIDIEVQRPKSFKTFNCVTSIYVLEAYMLMHKIFEHINKITVNGMAMISHGGVSQMMKEYGSYSCGKPGGVSQTISVSKSNNKSKKYIETQHQPGNIYDDLISLSLIVDIEDDDIELSDVYDDFRRLAGGDITDVKLTQIGDTNRKLNEVIGQGWVILDRKDLVKKFGRYDTLIGINTGAIQEQYAIEKDGRTVKPHLTIANLGYHVVGSDAAKEFHTHEILTGAVELLNVHNTERSIKDCLWKWTNFSNIFVLTQEFN